MEEETSGTAGVYRRNRHETMMARFRGRACKGQRLKMKAPFGHWGTQTFIAALRHDGLIAPWVIVCPMNRRIFVVCVEAQLAPTLMPGEMVILDNFSNHKRNRAAAILKERGAWFLFLPTRPSPGQPYPHFCGFVGRVIVHDDVDVEPRLEQCLQACRGTCGTQLLCAGDSICR
jgi:hypothetical protein